MQQRPPSRALLAAPPAAIDRHSEEVALQPAGIMRRQDRADCAAVMRIEGARCAHELQPGLNTDVYSLAHEMTPQAHRL